MVSERSLVSKYPAINPVTSSRRGFLTGTTLALSGVSGLISATELGLAGDGRDEGEALQNALDLCRETGDILYLGHGLHYVTSRALDASGVMIAGSSMARPRLQRMGDEGPLITVKGDFKAESVLFDGGRKSRPGRAPTIAMTQVRSVAFYDCHFEHSGLAAVECFSDHDDAEMIIEHCRFSKMALHGPEPLDATRAIRVIATAGFLRSRIAHCQFIGDAQGDPTRQPGGAMFAGDGEKSVAFIGNSADGIGQQSEKTPLGVIDIYNYCRAVWILENNIRRYNAVAIKTSDSRDLWIENNLITEPGPKAISAIVFANARRWNRSHPDNIGHCWIRGNSIYGQTDTSGILIFGQPDRHTSRITIADNIFDQGRYGIYTRHSFDVSIRDNHLSGCREAVMLDNSGDGPNAPRLASVRVKGGVMASCKSGIETRENVGNLVLIVESVIFRNLRTVALRVGEGAHVQIRQCTFLGTGSRNFDLDLAADVIIQDSNHIEG